MEGYTVYKSLEKKKIRFIFYYYVFDCKALRYKREIILYTFVGSFNVYLHKHTYTYLKPTHKHAYTQIHSIHHTNTYIAQIHTHTNLRNHEREPVVWCHSNLNQVHICFWRPSHAPLLCFKLLNPKPFTGLSFKHTQLCIVSIPQLYNALSYLVMNLKRRHYIIAPALSLYPSPIICVLCLCT